MIKIIKGGKTQWIVPTPIERSDAPFSSVSITVVLRTTAPWIESMWAPMSRIPLYVNALTVSPLSSKSKLLIAVCLKDGGAVAKCATAPPSLFTKYR